jgi:hypothetical protein
VAKIYTIVGKRETKIEIMQKGRSEKFHPGPYFFDFFDQA